MVGCLSENLIQELVAGGLASDIRAEAHRHIESCAACRMLVVELARDRDLDDDSELLLKDGSGDALLPTVAHIGSGSAARDLVDPGAVVGPYRIVRRIGRGGMGVVYEAEDPQLSRRVALKVLAPLRASDDDHRRRFRREARAAAAVVHPNVAAVYGVGHERGLEYLAMEYVTGTTLREAMRRRGGPFDIADATRIGEAIASGVGQAHELGIVHRDLKPENVMIAETGTVKVVDFGLAKLLDPASRDALGSSHGMTRDGHILGTPTYMSPEQSKGRPVDARSDVFALGVVLYELVTGSRPFRGETAVELFIAIDRDEPPAPSALNPYAPPALEAIVLRCLRKSPGDRFASCGEVAEALRRASSNGAPVAAGAELRLASVVCVALPAGSAGDAISQERTALAGLVAEYGAHAAGVRGGLAGGDVPPAADGGARGDRSGRAGGALRVRVTGRGSRRRDRDRHRAHAAGGIGADRRGRGPGRCAVVGGFRRSDRPRRADGGVARWALPGAPVRRPVCAGARARTRRDASAPGATDAVRGPRCGAGDARHRARRVLRRRANRVRCWSWRRPGRARRWCWSAAPIRSAAPRRSSPEAGRSARASASPCSRRWRGRRARASACRSSSRRSCGPIPTSMPATPTRASSAHC